MIRIIINNYELHYIDNLKNGKRRVMYDVLFHCGWSINIDNLQTRHIKTVFELSSIYRMNIINFKINNYFPVGNTRHYVEFHSSFKYSMESKIINRVKLFCFGGINRRVIVICFLKL